MGTKWSSLRRRGQNSAMKPDVMFRIGDSKKGVWAHKFILSTLSPVFRAEFYGHFEVHDVVKIRDTSRKIFLGMINFFYRKRFNIVNYVTNNNYGLEDVFELMKLADRYDVSALVELTKKTILEMHISEKDVVNSFHVAMKYEFLSPFTEVSSVTKQRCGDVLASNNKTANQLLKFLAKVTTDQPELEESIKIEMLKAMSKSKENKCHSCGNPPDTCVDGEKLTEDKLTIGRRVKLNRSGKLSFPCKEIRLWHGEEPIRCHRYLGRDWGGEVFQINSITKIVTFAFKYGDNLDISFAEVMENMVQNCDWPNKDVIE